MRVVRVGILMLLWTGIGLPLAQSEPKAHAYYAPRPYYGLGWPEGSGIFTVNINPKTGLVTSVSVKKSTGSAALDKSAIDALRRWKFRVPTKPSVEVPITFSRRPSSDRGHFGPPGN